MFLKNRGNFVHFKLAQVQLKLYQTQCSSQVANIAIKSAQSKLAITLHSNIRRGQNYSYLNLT